MRLLLTAHSHDDQRLHRSNIYRHQARPQAKSGSWSAGRFASERWPIGGNIVKNILVSTLTLAAAFATNLPAKALSGSFTFDGSVTATLNTITWQSNGGTADKANFGSTALTGDFSGLAGQILTIDNLDRASGEPVGTPFAGKQFVLFDTAPSLGILDITFIALGVFPSTDCHNPVRLPGQVCSLSTADVPGGSPFNFTNTASDGVHVDGSTVSFSFAGVTLDGQSKWSGVWTAQFNEAYQDIFTMFASGPITNSYSASVVVTPIPEPDTMILLGAGLLVVSLGVRRLRKA
jgi:hypothetical protein